MSENENNRYYLRFVFSAGDSVDLADNEWVRQPIGRGEHRVKPARWFSVGQIMELGDSDMGGRVIREIRPILSSEVVSPKKPTKPTTKKKPVQGFGMDAWGDAE